MDWLSWLTDPTLWLVLVGISIFGGTKTSSSSRSLAPLGEESTGIPQDIRILTGTSFRNLAPQLAGRAGFRGTLSTGSFDPRFGNLPIPEVALPTLPKLSARGLFPAQEAQFSQTLPQLLSQAFAPVSSTRALQGFITPASTADAAKTAAERTFSALLPMLMQTAGTNILQSLLVPEQIQQQRTDQFQNLLNAMLAATSGASFSRSSARSDQGLIGGLRQGVGLIGDVASLGGQFGVKALSGFKPG